MAEPRRGDNTSDRVSGARLLGVEAPYYQDISAMLWTGAARAIESAGATWERISVPGALEIPQAIAIALDGAERSGRAYDGAVALGCVIRGETSHYDIVAGESARALMLIAVGRGFPIGNGILTVDTEAQAIARASGDKLDKGGDAARAALALIALKRRG
jgi:6,7-dimethyl-8-ribityllumazine synthase